MQYTENNQCAVLPRSRVLSAENNDSCHNKHGDKFASLRRANNSEYSTQATNDMKTTERHNWQIALVSENCTIKRKLGSWQIYPKDVSMEKKESILNTSTTLEKGNLKEIKKQQPATTVDAETHCDREDICDLLYDKSNTNEQDRDCVMMKDCLKLMTTGDAKISFILAVLTKAVNEHKTFVISGVFPVLRKPLINRGWLEKHTIRKMLTVARDSMDSNQHTCSSEKIEKLLRSPADFIWYTNKKAFTVTTDDRTIVNKFAGSYFTSKVEQVYALRPFVTKDGPINLQVDLCNNLENIYWFYESGISNVQFPRCYNVYQRMQVAEFVEDYYITACSGLLKWFLFAASIAGANAVWSMNGTVPINAILFALERCAEYISVHNHEDIDRADYKSIPSLAWAQFLDWYHRIINKHAILIKNNKVDINELLRFTNNIMIEMAKYRPQSRADGMRNVWILKPGDKSLGRGIMLKNSLRDILEKVNQTAKESLQYVVQKYIERPLLIYETKIDVRQWFMITSTRPLIVWMYKDILIRFASKPFTLDDFHESIHLCNTTVQLKYRKAAKTNWQLPAELHWNLQNFKDYLKSRNLESVWDKTIKPGIKQNLVGALLASQDNMTHRRNSFQLYGADFVIMDDFSVWLIEINTNPRLHPPSSVITAELYPEIIEDSIKDRRKGRRAPRGKFECIFKQHKQCSGINIGQGVSLRIRGRSLLANPSSPRGTGQTVGF